MQQAPTRTIKPLAYIKLFRVCFLWMLQTYLSLFIADRGPERGCPGPREASEAREQDGGASVRPAAGAVRYGGGCEPGTGVIPAPGHVEEEVPPLPWQRGGGGQIS